MATRQLDIPKGNQPEVQDLSGGILSVIARAASDPNVDVDKLERLLAMQERVLGREAEQKFNEAMRSAQEEIRPVAKNKKNPETHSRYADLEAVSDAIDPIIHAHGFSLSFGSDASPLPDHYRVTCLASHTGGHSRNYCADVPLDNTGPKGGQNKTRTHGFGSSLSYGRRYLKLLIFDVATTDDDGRAAGKGATVDANQLAELNRLADDVGADKQRFCSYMKVDSLAAIPAKDYQRAIDALEAKRAQ
jgi:hypothetical protein